MKDIKILSLDLSSPRNFISTKKIKKQRDEAKFSFVSSWINIETDWHGDKYSSFFCRGD